MVVLSTTMKKLYQKENDNCVVVKTNKRTIESYKLLHSDNRI